MLLNSFFNLSLRALTLGGRFILLMAIARFLTASDVGIYGIVGSLIAYLLYFLGVDFYTFSTRDIIESHIDNLWRKLANQFYFFIINYVLLILCAKFIFGVSGVLDFVVIGTAIAITEHLSQEIYRVLISLEKIERANIQLFFRSGFWCYIISTLLYMGYVSSLKQVFILWSVFSIVSIFIGVVFILDIKKPNKKDFYLDIKWLVNGLKISSFFFIGTIFLRGVLFFDKIILQHIVDMKMVGVYVFFFGMSAATQSFIDILVVSRYFPGFMRTIKTEFKNGNKLQCSESLNRFRNKVLSASLLLCTLSIPACYIVISMLKKIEYVDNFSIYLCMLISTVFFLMSMPYHYFLYALQKDRLLVFINMIAFFIFLIISLISQSLIEQSSVYSVIFAIGVSYLFVLLIKRNKCKVLLRGSE